MGGVANTQQGGRNLIRFYFLIVLIAVGFIVSRKLLASGFWERPALYNKKTFLVIAGGLLMLLGVTGHLAWLTAAIGVFMAFMIRNLPILVRFAPQLQRFWRQFTASKRGEQSADYDSYHSYKPPPNGQGKMTAAEAYKILGLNPPVAKQDIILAHKKLMQKMHPDRGGSDYLASQINLAKDLLLKN